PNGGWAVSSPGKRAAPEASLSTRKSENLLRRISSGVPSILRDDSKKQGFEFLPRPVPRVPPHAFARRSSQPAAQLFRTRQSHYGFFQRPGVGRRNQQSIEVLFNHIRHSASFRRDHRHAAGHGLKQNGRQTFH